MGNAAQCIVFVGPTLRVDRAQQILPGADYRNPVKRGDLEQVGSGQIVGIIDGLLAESLAISRGEIREAIERGAIVYGAASMGALRAAELPAMTGVGRVFEMYRTGLIERDDEVAVTINPETYEPVTVPLVNVRFAVERLVRTGTLNRSDGNAIVDAALKLHYTERTYRQIFENSRLAGNRDIDDIIRLLQNFDLKRDDAHLLLETLASAPMPSATIFNRRSSIEKYSRARTREAADAPLMVWESGDEVRFTDLVTFLKVTGAFEGFARRAIGRMAASGLGQPTASQHHSDDSAATSQSLLDAGRAQWGWDSPEEAHVTMRDLGLGIDDVADSLDAEVLLERQIKSFAVSATEEFQKALRTELWLSELSLKREILRLGSLRHFAREGARSGEPSNAELLDAQRCVARLRRTFRWTSVCSALAALGMPADELGSMVREIALARRASRAVVEAMDRRPARETNVTPRADRWQKLGISSSPKSPTSARFGVGATEAMARAESIARKMGVVRIGLVGELDTLGIYIAQAFGARSGWSSSFSSGKAETREGARTGSIMEEVEIFAQDAYTPESVVRCSYAQAAAGQFVHPPTLGLPYDSCYTDDLQIDWAPCLDLVSGDTVNVPSASLVGERQRDDIFYCPRLGGKIFSSSGLGSGFSMAEAIVHAGAEYIERHAYRLAEIEIENPGNVGDRQFRFVDESTLPEAPARIVRKYHDAGLIVRIVDITSEIAVPTFYVRIFDDLFATYRSMSSDGFACHPDPEVAVTMALLEAAQTRGGYIAGGREDYSLHARSLGRHERPRTAVPRSQVFWFSNDRPVRPFDDTAGFRSRDILDELEWMVERVVEAGFPMFLVANYTTSRIEPAHAVRVLLPGLETTNPLFTGPRARATLLKDILPRGSYAR